MTTDDFIFNCKAAIRLTLEEKQPLDLSVVWLAKALQNRKALFANVEEKGDNRYWEVTYNGDKDEYYVDTYDKIDNTCVSNEKMKDWLYGV